MDCMGGGNVKFGPDQKFELSIPFERAFSKLSENHKSNGMGLP